MNGGTARDEAAAADGEHRRQALARDQERFLQALEDRVDGGTTADLGGGGPGGVDPPATRTITYRGQTMEVPVGSAVAGPTAGPTPATITYRGAPVDGAGGEPAAPSGPAPTRRRWGRRGRALSGEEKLALLRDLKAQHDAGELSTEAWEARKAEVHGR